MKLEAIWYEATPYVNLAVGLVAVLFSTSALGFAFSATLIASAVVVFCKRFVYRSPEREKLRKYGRPAPGGGRGRSRARA